MSLSFRTGGEGIVSIVGATPEEYQKRIEHIQDMKSREIKTEKVDEKKGAPVPIPGTKAAEEFAAQMSEKNDAEEQTLSFIDELEEKQIKDSQNNMMLTGIVVGIIVVIISILPVLPIGSFFATYTSSIFWINYAIMMGYNYNKKTKY